MYDGSDTAYYLELGYRVISVEANPDLVRRAEDRFRIAVASGQLTCVHAAVSPGGLEAELFLSGTDPGSSTLFGERLEQKQLRGGIKVPGITVQELFERYSIPDYLKVDIEGADRLCVLALTPAKRPRYLSFEVGDDISELLAHIESIGFNRFKLVNQKTFREIGNEDCAYDRFARRAMRYLGFGRPGLIRRGTRFFTVGHSSGPVPWESDGQWYSGKATYTRLRAIEARGQSSMWYDLHAALETI